jgi:hypothetical protein
MSINGGGWANVAQSAAIGVRDVSLLPSSFDRGGTRRGRSCDETAPWTDVGEDHVRRAEGSK